jgi:hypothetical protein
MSILFFVPIIANRYSAGIFWRAHCARVSARRCVPTWTLGGRARARTLLVDPIVD